MHAVVGALLHRVKTATTPELRAVVKIGMRMQREFSMLLMKESAHLRHEIVAIPEADVWFKDNQPYLEKDND